MRSRRLILGLILLTLLATCLAAAAKLRATPKYDRIQVGMTREDVRELLMTWENSTYGSVATLVFGWDCDEGRIFVTMHHDDEDRVASKHIERRGPLERLAWLAGWR